MMKSQVGRGLPSWGDYVRILYLRFGHALYENPRSELLGLKQTKGVQEFLDHFDGLL